MREAKFKPGRAHALAPRLKDVANLKTVADLGKFGGLGEQTEDDLKQYLDRSEVCRH